MFIFNFKEEVEWNKTSKTQQFTIRYFEECVCSWSYTTGDTKQIRGLSERIDYEKLSEMKKFDENRKTWNEMKNEPYITKK